MMNNNMMNNNNVDNYDNAHWANTTLSDPAMQVDTNSDIVSVVSDSVPAILSTSSAAESRKSDPPVNPHLFNMTRNIFEALPLIFSMQDFLIEQNEIIADALLQGYDKLTMDSVTKEIRAKQKDVKRFLRERYSITASQVKAWPHNSEAGNQKVASNGGRGGHRGGMRGRGRGGARGGSTRGRGGAAQK